MNWRNTIVCGDVLEIIQNMPAEFISCCMFSPPYWSLRDYKVEGQIGLEKDFNEYLVKMWLIFDELWRVLRKDGTMFVNMGDGYSSKTPLRLSDPKNVKVHTERRLKKCKNCGNDFYGQPLQDFCGSACSGVDNTPRIKRGLLEPKSLLMLPERLMLGLLDRGWILRNKCIWHKPNPMPCSAKDRFTTTWEYLFFLTKSKKYWFDLDAVRRPHKDYADDVRRIQKRVNYNETANGAVLHFTKDESRLPNPAGKNPGDVMTIKKCQQGYSPMLGQGSQARGERDILGYNPAGANPGDFWSIPTQPSKLPHYASYPEQLCETPLKAGCPRWICKQCGKARVRVTKRVGGPQGDHRKYIDVEKDNVTIEAGLTKHSRTASGNLLSRRYKEHGYPDYHTLGWSFCSCLCPACGEADCKCGEKWEPGIVLDPFVGIGTTCIVAKKLGLDYIGIDIKKEYCEIAEQRLKDVYYQEVFKI